MITGSTVRLKLPHDGHWKSSHTSRATGAVGEPIVRPSRGIPAAIGVGTVTDGSGAPVPAPGLASTPALAPGLASAPALAAVLGLVEPVPPFAERGRLSRRMAARATTTAPIVTSAVGDRQAG